jgi:signal transduction histidine kinase
LNGPHLFFQPGIALKITLLHKGLFLVWIPLIFEITFFAWLINLQDNLERQAQLINHNKNINDCVNLILRDILVISNTMQSGSFQALNAKSNKIISERALDIRQRFDRLEQLAQGDPPLQKKVENCEHAITLLFQDIKTLKQKLRSSSVENVPSIVGEATKQLTRHLYMTVAAGTLDLARESSLGMSDVVSKKLWRQSRIILKCALVISALVAITLAYLFSKNLVLRLAQLGKNAERLGQGQSLLPPLKGNDEIAELDRNFHHAAELIVAAKRMRQEVTAMITHDLKTPLQTVRSFLEMLQLGVFGKLNDTGGKLLSTAYNASEQMVALIDNVLQLEKLRSGNISLQREPIDITALVDKCIEFLKLIAEEKKVILSVDHRCSPEHLVFVDCFWIEQVIINILSNAIKFTPNGSTVSISDSSAAGSVEIRIADQGPGISKEEMKLVFDRFHRVQSTAATPGTGLGLPIAKELIELHGGSISVESEEGKGATFVLRLPAAKPTSIQESELKTTVGEPKPEDQQRPQADQIAPAHAKACPARPKLRKLTLLHKGLILVSIPLCFELTIFGCLINLQDQVEQEAQRISHNKQFNDAANIVIRDLIYLGMTVGHERHEIKRNPMSEPKVRHWFEEIQQTFVVLKQLAEKPRTYQYVVDVEKGVDLIGVELGRSRRLQTDGADELSTQINARFMTGMLHLGDRSDSSQFDLRSNELRKLMRMLLMCAIGFSILFAMVGALVYSRQLVARLQRLGDNASRLAKGEPLLARIGGSDEVAELDANFHFAAEQIEAAQRMRQEATAMIIHDLKTPLQSVRSYFEMLERGSFGEMSENGKRLLSSSQRASRHMVDLVNSVLQLEKLRTGNVQLQTASIDLTELLDKSVDSIKVLADQKHISMIREYQHSGSFNIDGDAFWLEQIFVNILSNAIKFSPEDSTVSIRTQHQQGDVEIAFTDEGSGIPEADLKHVFERFHRVESSMSVPGTGLGLPIAKELVELHHGTITLESTVGKGSTFSIRFPLRTVDLITL